MSTSSLCEDWLRITSATGFLLVESAAVIWLRSSLFINRDPGGRDEAVRMVSEKFSANVDLAVKFAKAGPRSGSEAAMLSVNHYGSLVRANRKRLVDRRLARKLAGH